ncbi:Serine hydrolase (FSH1) family protein [Spironucleus salmonicida]|uniref:Serine hydrolase (FSH1) family protein n=1 Tax=Spironucleus salmonicida TaxID=348837 RepID=V6LBJ0_9EUKA|nr:Serine hydrolase (FSH1) family protein [Spironucleus salmonicida]|eukprot:EST41830.1 Serine hydrolase (FSH1) family protein [Spironucleus salmonicida]
MKKTLLLHGFGQNGQSFYTRLGSIRRLNKKQEYYSPDAPFTVVVENGQYVLGSDPPVNVAAAVSDIQDNAKAYYVWEIDQSVKSGRRFYHLQESVNFIIDLIQKNNYDNIIAFSQGATALLCALKQSAIQVKVCLVSPWWYDKIYSQKQPQLIENIIQQDILQDITVIYGKTDNSISQQSFHTLRLEFPNFKYIEHEGGHFVPGNKDFKQFWKEWLA